MVEENMLRENRPAEQMAVGRLTQREGGLL